MKTKEEIKEYNRQYNQNNKEKIAEQKKIYYKEHKNEILEKKKNYQEKHKSEIKEYRKRYYSTQFGRAKYLLYQYKKGDYKTNRVECTLTEQWIIDNIFNSKCYYCGETDWKKLGCDRIDNSKPHTPDNIICSCTECNRKRSTKTIEKFTKENGK